MKFDNNIMVDCETLSTRNNAALVSIGAVQFSLSSLEVRDTLYLPIDLESYNGHEEKFHVDLKSVAWWMTQDPAVLKETFVDTVEFSGSQVRWPIYNALDALAKFCQVRNYAGPPVIWSNDETADAVWLENAYRSVGQSVPWSYQSHRCFRTTMTFAEEMGVRDEVYAAHQLSDDKRHNALADAQWQAEVVLEVFKHLREGLK